METHHNPTFGHRPPGNTRLRLLCCAVLVLGPIRATADTVPGMHWYW